MQQKPAKSTSADHTLLEPERITEIRYETDVCVVGGGAAGVAAAVAAGRMGKRVLLLERAGFLGGTLTAVSLGSMCGLYAVTPESITQIVRGFAQDVIEKLQANGSGFEPVRWLKTASLPYDLFTMKVVLDQLVAEAGVKVLLHSQVVAVKTRDGLITHVITDGKSGRWAVQAKQFIDCSGDADLVHLCGSPYEFDISSLQMPTAMFRLGGVDSQVVAELDREMLRSKLESAYAKGWPLPRTAGGVFMERPGIAHLNITKVSLEDRAPNPLDPEDISEAEKIGRVQVQMYQKVFKDFVPGFASAYVLDTGSTIGIRESRRLVGEYVFDVDDARSASRFDDAIACCAWPMEDHSAGRGTKWVWLEDGSYYQIPYRCLLPKGVDNLLVAGRCVSSTHDAQASLRVTAQCFAMGQAAGTAASLCVSTGSTPRHVDINQVQTLLKRAGAYLGESV